MSMRKLLGTRSFLFLWLGQILSQLADRVLVYVLLVTFYHVAKSNLGVSLANLAYAIPAFLFSALFGVFVDHYRKKYILVFTHAGRAILILLMFVFPGTQEHLVSLFIISFLIFTLAQIFSPAETAYIPELVPPKNLVLANGLFMGTWMATSVFGFALATPIAEYFSLKANYFLIAAGYLGAALLALGIHSDEHLSHQAKVKNVIRGIFQGFRYVRHHWVLQLIFGLMFFGVTLLSCVSVLALRYVEEILKLPPEKFGILISFAGVGMLLGVLLLDRLKNYISKQSLIRLGFLFAAIALVVIAQVDQISYAYWIVFVLGLGNAFITVPIQTLIQENVVTALRGRVFGIQNMIMSLAFTVPPIAIAYVADLRGIQMGFLSLGILAAVLFLLQVAIPSVHRLR